LLCLITWTISNNVGLDLLLRFYIKLDIYPQVLCIWVCCRVYYLSMNDFLCIVGQNQESKCMSNMLWDAKKVPKFLIGHGRKMAFFSLVVHRLLSIKLQQATDVLGDPYQHLHWNSMSNRSICCVIQNHAHIWQCQKSKVCWCTSPIKQSVSHSLCILIAPFCCIWCWLYALLCISLMS